jgi:putative flavoprotein involved in K+ transport
MRFFQRKRRTAHQNFLRGSYKKGVIHLGRIAGVHKGWPITADGKEIHVNTTIWSTGFLSNYSWIKLQGILDGSGYPLTNRGVSSVIEGLFFAGSMFQYSLTSVWIGGVGRDAEFIAEKLPTIIKEINR